MGEQIIIRKVVSMSPPLLSYLFQEGEQGVSVAGWWLAPS
jgi:hypothetical protein